MSDSGILQEVIKIERANKSLSSHFALCNGDKIRYLIAIEGGKKRLSRNISTYSGRLGLLMKLLNFLPFSFLERIKLGYFANVMLHPSIEKRIHNLNPDEWNMIVGTYDEKQKLVLQCFWDSDPLAIFVKIGNKATEREMQAEMNFLKSCHTYQSFTIPSILDYEEKNSGCPFNLIFTKEFVGEKVEPELTEDIIKIYHEMATMTKVIDGVEYEFSHGDFAPWNIKKNRNQYTVFDWEHCGYRIKGFDLMHYVTIIEMVVHKKSLDEAFAYGIEKINRFEPAFTINRETFLREFEHLRKQIG